MSSPAGQPGSANSTTRVKLRPLARLLEATGASFWCLDGQARLVYASPALLRVLGVEWEQIRGVCCIPSDGAGHSAAAEGDGNGDAFATDPGNETWRLADLLANLLPPDGLSHRGHSTRRVHLNRRELTSEMVAHFVWLRPHPGDEPLQPEPIILGCVGEFVSDADVARRDWSGADGLANRTRVTELVDQRRRLHRERALWALLGESDGVRQARRQIELASTLEIHIGLIGHEGSGLRSIASDMAASASAGERASVVTLDGSLMDAELLEVYAQPVMASLMSPLKTADSVTEGCFAGTLIIDRLSDMAHDAQQCLVQWLTRWPNQWRLIGILRDQPAAAPDGHAPGGQRSLAAKSVESNPNRLPSDDQSTSSHGLLPRLQEHLSTFAISVPRLAERREDLGTLATARIRSLWQSTPRSPAGPNWTDPPQLASDALDAMMVYPWPGDTDELDACLRHALADFVGSSIHRQHLPLAVRSFSKGRFSGDLPSRFYSARMDPDVDSDESLDDQVRSFERALIRRAIEQSDGNKAEAARKLGLSRSRLLRKLDEARQTDSHE